MVFGALEHEVPDNAKRRVIYCAALTAGLLLANFRGSLAWLVFTWREATYESFGFVALLLAVVLARRAPGFRAAPSRAHLLGVGVCALFDLALSPLDINVLSAALGMVALHLWAVAFFDLRGRWYAQPQLHLALLSLPAVHWANVLFGYSLQHAVTRAAAGALSLYGLPATVTGTLIHLPGGTTVSVDAACSGLKLLYSGVLLGVLLAPGLAGTARKAALWAGLLLLLLGANVVRVVCLTVAHLHLGHPVGDAAHEAIGLVAFALCCGLVLLGVRALRPGPGAFAHCTNHEVTP